MIYTLWKNEVTTQHLKGDCKSCPIKLYDLLEKVIKGQLKKLVLRR